MYAPILVTIFPACSSAMTGGATWRSSSERDGVQRALLNQPAPTLACRSPQHFADDLAPVRVLCMACGWIENAGTENAGPLRAQR